MKKKSKEKMKRRMRRLVWLVRDDVGSGVDVAGLKSGGQVVLT